MSTDVAVRESNFDLTRAPQERWNKEMIEVVQRNVFRNLEITQAQLYYCLSVAEGIGLNPMIGEVYFLPSKSHDAKGPAWTPYIGRNGLVATAARAGHHYESETVHALDRFRMTRKKDGTVEVTHSYTQADRGEIVGAYAFLHDDSGARKPTFFYAKLSEYLPTFDADWKMGKSPWGNQRSAMIEKCAMIGAGRKRLRLGNVLADGEIARVQQMQAITGPPPEQMRAAFEWAPLEERVGSDPVDRLRDALERLHELDEHAWPAAKLEMVTANMSAADVLELASMIEGQINDLLRDAQSPSPEPPADPDQPPAQEPGSAAAPGSASEGQEITGEPVTDAVVVPDAEHVAALRSRAATLDARLKDGPWDEREQQELGAELDQVNAEIEAAGNPDQGSLL